MDAPDFVPPRDLRKDGTGTVSYGLDDGMLVEFFEEPEHMEYLSKTTGHPIFRMRIMTRIMQPGNRNTVWVHATKGITYEMVIDEESGEYHTNWDILEVCENGDAPEPTKYPIAWNRFLRKGVTADSGLPIEQWGTVTRSYAESLKASHIHTVQALASLTDSAAQSIMGAIKYRDLARAYLDDAKRTEILASEQEGRARAQEQNAELTKKVEALQQHVLTLQSRISGSEVPAPAGRMVASAEPIANEIRKMSKGEAQKKHKIPGPENRAA
jgi:hypothetical protein